MTIPLIGITSNEKPVAEGKSFIQTFSWAIINEQTKSSLIILLSVFHKA